MAENRERVRDMVSGGKEVDTKTPTHKADPGSPHRAAGTTGTGGGLPDNPEARRAQDFGPGGSAGAGASESAMRSPGGAQSGTDNRAQPRGSGELPVPAVNPGESSANLGEREPGLDERKMRNSPSNRERDGLEGIPN
jgi:hypothetical protein